MQQQVLVGKHYDVLYKFSDVNVAVLLDSGLETDEVQGTDSWADAINLFICDRAKES